MEEQIIVINAEQFQLITDYLDCINQLLINVNKYIMLNFIFVSIIAGIFIGYKVAR